MTTVVGGELKRTDLCEDCARESGAIHPSGFLSAETLMTGSASATGEKTEKCPACGYSLDTLHKTGRLGCAVCYEKFSASLATALQESQKAMTHVGKRPGRQKASYEELEAEMRQLIRTEQYEEAAKLRDRLATRKPVSRKGKTG
jgi:protein arginine kinase activator